MSKAGAMLFMALLAALALVPPAGASVAIRGLDTSGYPAIRLTVVSSKPVSIKPALAENGRAVVGLEAQNLGKAKAVVLALDRSQSMAGRSLADAVAAARAFVRIKAAGDRFGLIAFGQSATEQAALSSSTGDLVTSLEAMHVDTSAGTALYDA
ncbi:MAG: VWA domain-containing protein, partial [Gaiellaceae bacterium]